MIELIKKLPDRFKMYPQENWGAPFFAAFLLLLVVAAASLAVGSADLAKEVAIYAYYALVVGSVLQLVCFVKYNKRNDEDKSWHEYQLLPFEQKWGSVKWVA
jgi:hypothetical protein